MGPTHLVGGPTWVGPSQNFGTQKTKKIKNLKIKIRVAQNVGKVWISRKKNSWPHLGPSGPIFCVGRENRENAKTSANFCVYKPDYLPTFLMAWIGQPNYLPTFWMAWIGQPDYLPTFWNTGHPVAETKVNPIWISTGFLVCWPTFIKLPAGFCVSKPGYMPAFWIVWIGQPHYMPTFWMAWIGH